VTMNDREVSPKVLTTHRHRLAVVYVRQSTASQVERNTESTDRQYALADRAVGLGWPRDAVRVIDADLGRSGASTTGRSGFAELTTLVGLGQVGIVLALEVSRLARNNSDWYRLLDLSGMTNTLLADADGVYHPGLFNDRMLLGLKGTMSEAELHVLRARLDGGIRNKAQRGELRRGLPVGLVWGDDEGQILWHPDEAVTGVIAAVFDRFAACGSVRGTWLWLREEKLKWPLQPAAGATSPAPLVIWVEPTYHAVHTVLTHPAYTGAYVYGRSRTERYVTADGDLKTRRRRIGRDEWEVCIPDHHQGFLDWNTYLGNQQRIGANIRPTAHQPGTGAVREGCALLQGLAVCGDCGRKLAVYYDGRHHNTPGYYCTGTGNLVDGRDVRHLRIGGVGIDAAVAQTFLAALAGDAPAACLTAAQQLTEDHHGVLDQHRRQVQQARYDAVKAERRYLAVDAENRLVARGLETAWEKALTALAAAEAELADRETRTPRTLTPQQHRNPRAR
jgi:DNA invertase Pin-like site-specific DNA recombinase